LVKTYLEGQGQNTSGKRNNPGQKRGDNFAGEKKEWEKKERNRTTSRAVRKKLVKILSKRRGDEWIKQKNKKKTGGSGNAPKRGKREVFEENAT